jgi:predicted dehydrogenase
MSITRRAFVPSALAAIAAADAPRVKIGFLGASHAHGSTKVKLVLASPRFELAGAAEDDASTRVMLEKNGVRLLTREQLLGDTNIQAIAVESQAKDHARDTLDVLNAGKHVHVEKPPAGNMKAMREIVALARRKNLLLQVGYMWRQNPGPNAVIEAVRKGWLGKVYFVRGSMNITITPEMRRDWARYRGGHMFDLNCHVIDFLVRLMGRPQKVSPFLRSDGGFGDKMNDNTLAVLEWRDALGVVNGAAMRPNPFLHRSIEVAGTNGTAILAPIEPPALTIDLAKPAGPYKAGRNAVRLAAYVRHEGEFQELADSIVNRKPLSVTLDEDLAVQETLLRASEMR